MSFCFSLQNLAAVAGVIDLGRVETFSVFEAAQRGLIDQDTCRVLLEAQLVLGGLVQPDSTVCLSLDRALNQGLIDVRSRQSLSEFESALGLIKQSMGDQSVSSVAAAMESGLIREEVGLRVLELQMKTGGLRDSCGNTLSLEQAEDMRALSPRIITKLEPRLQHKELIDPNTAEQINIEELKQRCIIDDDSGQLLLPVKQHPGGTVCLRSGRKVRIFRAVQERLIDREVTVRLLEAQFFAGGISDPRTGHRLTIGEAVRHGLMDQDLACTMLVRQLQRGGIFDPLSREHLDLEEGIRRDLLSPCLALLVLESSWAFMGILWPESGELMPVAEAVQQGLISGDLARKILRQRHVIGGLYNPETLKVLPLRQAAVEDLDPDVVRCLRDIHIPDVYNMNQAGPPSLNRLSWGSISSTPPSPLLSSSTGIMWETTDRADPEEEAKFKLLFHIMSHSYVDLHSGKRLVLLDHELMVMVKATDMPAEKSDQADPLSSLTVDQPAMPKTDGNVSLSDQAASNNERMTDEDNFNVLISGNYFEIDDVNRTEAEPNGKADNLLQKNSSGTEGSDELVIIAKNKMSVNARINDQKEENFCLLPEEILSQCTKGTVNAAPLKSKEVIEKEVQPGYIQRVKAESEETKLIKRSHTDLTEMTQGFPETEIDSSQSETLVDEVNPETEKLCEEAELERLVFELKQGGLKTEEGEKLLPDEAVAQGVLPGHTAVKLMAQAGLFGGFLDASSAESLSMEEVMQEGLLDEDLMWSVLKSDKTIAGIVDVEKRQICGVRDAAQAGLIDSNTAARLLEAQVVSGGIVDLCRDKKVSVTLAENLGLIEEEQRGKLMALEKAYKGKDADSVTTLMKASLQLQMEGVVDPESKSPVSLEQAIKKWLITSEEAYQVLAKQVAEGGIIHHASGMRLSVSAAVDRGLVDRSITPGLEELEWVYQGKASASSNPDTVAFQATTGAILDPDTGVRLTLTEAVAKGLLEENVANEVMASPSVTQGAINPQTAQIVPYSELVNQGKIDIETGKRFLEVKPFLGVQSRQAMQNLTLPEAVALKRVDPVPALRLLQTQADSGGIIDFRTGERLPLPEASARGFVEDNMAKEIATNQFIKGGIIDPATRRRVSSLTDAVSLGLITSDLALEIQEKVEADDNSTTIMSIGSSPECPENWSDSYSGASSRSPPSIKSVEVMQDDDKRSTPLYSEKPLLYGKTPENDRTEESESAGENSLSDPDQSMDVLLKFTSDVEKRIQQSIKDITPQREKSMSLPKPDPNRRMEIDEGKTDDGQKKTKDSVGETSEMVFNLPDQESLEEVREEEWERLSVRIRVQQTEKKEEPDQRFQLENDKTDNGEEIMILRESGGESTQKIFHHMDQDSQKEEEKEEREKGVEMDKTDGGQRKGKFKESVGESTQAVFHHTDQESQKEVKDKKKKPFSDKVQESKEEVVLQKCINKSESHHEQESDEKVETDQDKTDNEQGQSKFGQSVQTAFHPTEKDSQEEEEKRQKPSDVMKIVQETEEEITSQKDISKSESLPKQELDQNLEMETDKTDDKQRKDKFMKSVGESILTVFHHTEQDSQKVEEEEEREKGMETDKFDDGQRKSKFREPVEESILAVFHHKDQDSQKEVKDKKTKAFNDKVQESKVVPQKDVNKSESLCEKEPYEKVATDQNKIDNEQGQSKFGQSTQMVFHHTDHDSQKDEKREKEMEMDQTDDGQRKGKFRESVLESTQTIFHHSNKDSQTEGKEVEKEKLSVKETVQETKKKIRPLKGIYKSENVFKLEADIKLEIDEDKTDKLKIIFTDSVGESTQTIFHPVDKDSQTEVKEDEQKQLNEDEGFRCIDETSLTTPVPGDINLTEMTDNRGGEGEPVPLTVNKQLKDNLTAQRSDLENSKEIKTITAAEHSDQIEMSASEEFENKSKKKKKNRKKIKDKEVEAEPEHPKIKHLSQTDGAGTETTKKLPKSDTGRPPASPDPPCGEKIDKTEKDSVKQEQEELLEPNTEAEKDGAKTVKISNKVVEKVEFEEAFVSEEPESNQEVNKGKDGTVLKKSTLKDDEKAALILKAKESILKKVLERGVSEKQAAEELEALRRKYGERKEVKVLTAGNKEAERSEDKCEVSFKKSGSAKDDVKDQKTVKDHKLEEKSEGLQSTVQETLQDKPSKASSSEKEQKNIETFLSVKPKETSKRSKKSKKSKSSTVTVKDDSGAEKLTVGGYVDSELPADKNTSRSKPDSDGSGLAQDQKVKMDDDGLRVIIGSSAELQSSLTDKESDTSELADLSQDFSVKHDASGQSVAPGKPIRKQPSEAGRPDVTDSLRNLQHHDSPEKTALSSEEASGGSGVTEPDAAAEMWEDSLRESREMTLTVSKVLITSSRGY